MNRRFFAVVFLISGILAFAQNVDDFEVEPAAGNSVRITGYRGRERDIKIPDTIGGYRVTEIGEFVFNGLTGVTIPDGVVYIGLAAFSNNRLTRAIMPDSVTVIEIIAFQDNLLEEIVLPANLTRIGQMAFTDNRLRNVVFQNRVTRIEDGAFENNEITELDIPGSVREIGSAAFKNNPLEKITIGAKVEFSEWTFDEGFFSCYNGNGARAGTYIKRNGIWELVDRL